MNQSTLEHDNYDATLGARGARFIASIIGDILSDGVGTVKRKERVDLLEVKGSDDHPAKGCDG